jgi:hypothetical protein
MKSIKPASWLNVLFNPGPAYVLEQQTSKFLAQAGIFARAVGTISWSGYNNPQPGP